MRSTPPIKSDEFMPEEIMSGEAPQLPPQVSVGSLIKKLLAINPDLNVPQLIQIVRSSTHAQVNLTDDFANAEIIDEAQAISLARATCS